MSVTLDRPNAVNDRSQMRIAEITIDGSGTPQVSYPTQPVPRRVPDWTMLIAEARGRQDRQRAERPQERAHADRLRSLDADFAAWAERRGASMFFSRTPFFETTVRDMYSAGGAYVADSADRPTDTTVPQRSIHGERFGAYPVGPAARLDPPGTPGA